MELRLLGYDVLTSYDAGNANSAAPDPDVFAFARSERRILLSYGRRHFLQLHQRRTQDHSGIVICSYDPDFAGQALRISKAIAALSDLTNQLIRVNRPG